MAKFDRDTARALAEAGYMPLSDYVAEFELEASGDASLVPELCDDPHDSLGVEPLEFHRPGTLAELRACLSYI